MAAASEDLDCRFRVYLEAHYPTPSSGHPLVYNTILQILTKELGTQKKGVGYEPLGTSRVVDF